MSVQAVRQALEAAGFSGTIRELDESLRRFETVFPAAGSSNSAVEMTLAQLESCCGGFVKWADLCRGWREAE